MFLAIVLKSSKIPNFPVKEAMPKLTRVSNQTYFLSVPSPRFAKKKTFCGTPVKPTIKNMFLKITRATHAPNWTRA